MTKIIEYAQKALTINLPGPLKTKIYFGRMPFRKQGVMLVRNTVKEAITNKIDNTNPGSAGGLFGRDLGLGGKE